jgi:hypothetical protein
VTNGTIRQVTRTGTQHDRALHRGERSSSITISGAFSSKTVPRLKYFPRHIAPYRQQSRKEPQNPRPSPHAKFEANGSLSSVNCRCILAHQVGDYWPRESQMSSIGIPFEQHRLFSRRKCLRSRLRIRCSPHHSTRSQSNTFNLARLESVELRVPAPTECNKKQQLLRTGLFVRRACFINSASA